MAHQWEVGGSVSVFFVLRPRYMATIYVVPNLLPVDTKTKVAFYHMGLIVKQNFCYYDNARLGTTWMVTLYKDEDECLLTRSFCRRLASSPPLITFLPQKRCIKSDWPQIVSCSSSVCSTDLGTVCPGYKVYSKLTLQAGFYKKTLYTGNFTNNCHLGRPKNWSYNRNDLIRETHCIYFCSHHSSPNLHIVDISYRLAWKMRRCFQHR